MSYGCDQTQSNRLRIWLIIFFFLALLGIAAGVFAWLRWTRFQQAQARLLDETPGVFLGGIFAASSTPLATRTMTALPTFTPNATISPTGTLYPAATGTPGVNLNVFPYNVDQILYLAASYQTGRYWKPGDAVAQNVPQSDYDAIMNLLFAQQVQREQTFSTETFPNYQLLNDGYAITQLQTYYNTSITRGDDCSINISVIDGQFQTFIIEYDGTYARTMTVKMENRVEDCTSSAETRTTYRDYYGYENLLQKFGTTWKIIEHTTQLGIK